jgi:hypothetical protein
MCKGINLMKGRRHICFYAADGNLIEREGRKEEEGSQ